MKRLLVIAALGICFSLIFTNTADAQNYGRKKKKKPSKVESVEKTKKSSETFDKIWIGTGLDGIGIGSSTFEFAISPIVGYKITPKLSAGLRVPVDYTYRKFFDNAGGVYNYNNLDVGLGGFTRMKIVWGLFAHTEYNRLWLEQPATVGGGQLVIDPKNPNKILKESFTKDEFNVGIGYNSGGKVGYEVSVLYDVLEDSNSANLPFSIRVGLNYKF